jgi:hypothetical protein
MKIYYPALVTSALFTALLILDLLTKRIKLFAIHFIFALIAVTLMVYLSQKDLDIAAWGIFTFPFILLCAGLIIGYLNPAPGNIASTPPSTLANTVTCTTCGQASSSCLCSETTPIVTPPTPVVTDLSGCTSSSTPSPVVTPTTPVTTCGDGGKTQCIDTRSLSSA